MRSVLAQCVVVGVLVAGCSPASSASSPDKVTVVNTFRKEQAPDKLLAEGKALAALGDSVRAEEYLAAALAGGGNDKEIVPILVQVCVNDGRLRSAIDYAEPYVQRHPDDTRARYLLGTLYNGIGAFDRARAEYEAVVSAAPDVAEPHWALALLLRDDVNDPNQATVQFREYLRLAPTGPHADEARASIKDSP
jgi:tetratricopeptide (TPR) repeat protein